MSQHGMEAGHGCAHHAQIQAVINQLPPGILVGVLEAMLEFDMRERMAFHAAIEAGLLDQPPGQILKLVRGGIY